MSLIDKVLSAAKSIQDSGKQPSLALIKARTGGSVPMPILIQGLQTFRAMPEAEQDKLLDTQAEKPAKEEELSLILLSKKIVNLEHQVSLLMANNAKLEKKITQLQQDKKD